MTQPPEGQIRIELTACGGKGAVRIENTRPLQISSRFSGRSPSEVAKLVPLVFSICSAAQSAACAEALECALATGADGRARSIRALLTLSETAREHALQVLHSWPQCLRAPQPAMARASIKQLLILGRELSRCLGAGAAQLSTEGGAIESAGLGRKIAELNALLGEAIYGELPAEWLARSDFEHLSLWAQRNETPAQTIIEYLVHSGMADAGAADIAPLPPMDREELKTILLGPNAAAFAAQPEWEGRPRETTPLSRVLDHGLVASVKDRYGYGLLARMVACLIELAEIPGRMHSLAATLKPERQEAQPAMPRKSGTGIGIAEAARGRLVHAVEIADGLVRRYRILAPTEWNFHPDGAAARGLASIALAAPQHREMLARLFIAAVDPCVGYELRLS